MRLSSPVDELLPHYDTVIIGSGYGGSVAACQLARGLPPTHSIALLEAGKEWTTTELAEQGEMGLLTRTRVSVASAKLQLGSSNALYASTTSATTTVAQGCGLGGGSLVNAAVVAWPAERVFQSPHWPSSFRADQERFLDVDRKAARDMLLPERYPHPHSKATAASAVARDMEDLAVMHEAELAINMQDGRAHPVSGVLQSGCVGCGNCCSGCPTGAKNVLTANYLAVAKQHGVSIFSELRVTAIQPLTSSPSSSVSEAGAGFLIHFRYFLPGVTFFVPPCGAVHASRVIVAAGVMDTFRILARSREEFKLPVSSRLGERFSSNGSASHVVTGAAVVAGRGHSLKDTYKLPHSQRPGPAISFTFDGRTKQGLAGASVNMQPCTAPLLVDRSFQLSMMLSGGWKGLPFLLWPFRRAHTLTLLSEGHDDSAGRLVYHKDSHAVEVEWDDLLEHGYIGAAEKVAARLAKLWGCRHLGFRPTIPHWLSNSGGSKHVMLTHALGGCAMADSGEQGVVNHRGQVFVGAGTAVHANLYVVDGSIVPVSLGTNPFLTITALAERVCRLIVADDSAAPQPCQESSLVHPHPRPRRAPRSPSPQSGSSSSPRSGGFLVAPRKSANELRDPPVIVTERLAGFLVKSTPSTSLRGPGYQGWRAYHALLLSPQCPGVRWPCDFTVSIVCDNYSERVNSPTGWLARVQPGGELNCPALSAYPLVIKSGYWSCFVPGSDGLEMNYEIIVDDSRNPHHWQQGVAPRTARPTSYTLIGRKYLTPRWLGWSGPRDTTRLYTQVLDAQGVEIMSGLTYIHFSDFMKQNVSLAIANDFWPGLHYPLVFLKRCFALYWGQHMRQCLTPPFVFRSPAAQPVRRSRLRQHTFPVDTEDHRQARVTRWRGAEKHDRPLHPQPYLLLHGGAGGLGVRALTHAYNEINLVEFLLQKGHDVWTMEWSARASLEAARFDVPACVEAVCAHTQQPALCVFAHGPGALVMQDSLALGALPATRVHRLILSHPEPPEVARVVQAVAPVLSKADGWVDEHLVRPLCQLVSYMAQPYSEWCTHRGCSRTTVLHGSRGFSHVNVSANIHAAIQQEGWAVWDKEFVSKSLPSQASSRWRKQIRLSCDVLMLQQSQAAHHGVMAKDVLASLPPAGSVLPPASPTVTIAQLPSMEPLDWLVAEDAAETLWPHLDAFATGRPMDIARRGRRATLVTHKTALRGTTVEGQPGWVDGGLNTLMSLLLLLLVSIPAKLIRSAGRAVHLLLWLLWPFHESTLDTGRQCDAHVELHESC